MELLSLVFRLAGHDEYNQTNSKSPYSHDAEEQFAAFHHHPVVERAIRLREAGIGYDAPMSLAVHLSDEQPLRLLKASTLDSRWAPHEADAFVAELNDFVAQTDFSEFFDQHCHLYEAAAASFRRGLAGPGHVQWFDSFFGSRPRASHRVVVAMLNGGACYGPHVQRPDGAENVYSILGASEFDAAGVPACPQFYADMLVHEFAHTYIGDLVDERAAVLAPLGESLFQPFSAFFEQQAYGSGLIVLEESLVRAAVVECLRATRGEEAAAHEVEEQTSRAFLRIGRLSELFRSCSEDRSQYHVFADFMPRVEAFFGKCVREELPRIVENMPKLLAIDPENDARHVNPATTTVRVTFDWAMGEGFAVVGGGEHYPERAGQPAFNADRTVFTMPVRVKPDWEYEFWLNHGRYCAFRSLDGVPLQPVRVRFKTR